MDSLTSSILRSTAMTVVPAGGVQGEDVGEVVAGADDRADDGLAVDDGVEDRQAQRRVVSGQRDADQAPAAAQRPVGLVEGPG